MSKEENGAAWGSLLTGLASVATLPLAIYLTRFSSSYELLQSAFAIPVAVTLAFVSLALARRARLRIAASLGSERSGIARGGHVLGVVGLCMAAVAVVSLCVYALLEYVGSRG